MPDLARSRDLIILFKGDTLTPVLSDTMRQNGWVGGQGVQWAAPSKDEFKVTFSDGLYAGFMLFGSDESSDKFTSMTGNQVVYAAGAMGFGGWLISTIAFERYTYASRQSGPLAPITYNSSDRLLFSLRGLWTKEDEWTLSGDSRAPNNYFIGYVSQPPSALTRGYMTIQCSI
jgi:hypothetical protein